MRNLIIVLGDQLTLDSPALRNIDTENDCIWMAEVNEEATHVWSHKARLLLFLSAMRNFRKTLRKQGYWTMYHTLGEHTHKTLTDALCQDIRRYQPQRLIMVQPGDYRVLAAMQSLASQEQVRLDILPDTHFMTELDFFEEWMSHGKQHRQEQFYRQVRRQTGILIAAE